MQTLDQYPEQMSPPEVAEYLNVSEVTLKTWRRTGKGPSYVKLGTGASAPVRYPREKLREYLASRVVTPAVAG